tara:strand:- start:931 stop:1443 length:513 start_codon:yes stop_codon:yes gene_type:complete
MSIQFRPVGLPGPEYSPEEESQFRRSLETYLLDISSVVNDSESATNGLASSASKRESLIPVPSSFRYPFTPSASSESPVALISGFSIHYTGNPVLMIPDTTAILTHVYGGFEGLNLTLVKVGSANSVQLSNIGSGPGSMTISGTVVYLQSVGDAVTLLSVGGEWIRFNNV